MSTRGNIPSAITSFRIEGELTRQLLDHEYISRLGPAEDHATDPRPFDQNLPALFAAASMNATDPVWLAATATLHLPNNDLALLSEFGAPNLRSNATDPFWPSTFERLDFNNYSERRGFVMKALRAVLLGSIIGRPKSEGVGLGELSGADQFARQEVDFLTGYERYNQRNWDGHDAEPISAETVQYARQLLAVIPETFGPPDIAPSADGSIGLEWVPESGPLSKLFLDIGPGEEWRAYWKRRTGNYGRLSRKSLSAETGRIFKALFEDLNQVN